MTPSIIFFIKMVDLLQCLFSHFHDIHSKMDVYLFWGEQKPGGLSTKTCVFLEPKTPGDSQTVCPSSIEELDLLGLDVKAETRYE